MSSLRGERTTQFSLKSKESRSNCRWRSEHRRSCDRDYGLADPTDEEILGKVISKNRQLSKTIDHLNDQIDGLEFYKVEYNRTLQSFKGEQATIKKLRRENQEQRVLIESQQLKLDTFERLFEELKRRDDGTPHKELELDDLNDTTSRTDVSDQSESQENGSSPEPHNDAVWQIFDKARETSPPKPMWKRLTQMRRGGVQK